MIRRAFLFGELRVVDERGTERSLVARTHDARRLFALLVLTPTTGRRDVLAAQLWPEVPDEVGRARLRYCLTMLRRAVGEGALISPGGDSLALSPEVQLDTRQFWERVQEAVLARESSSRIEALQEALRLASNPLLPGWSEPWIVRERIRLEACRQDILRALAADLTRLGREEEAALWRHLVSANDSPTLAE